MRPLWSRAMPSRRTARPNPRPIRGILFDKDGTLLDYAASWTPINVQAAVIASRGDRGLAVRLLALGGADEAGGSVAADSLLAAGSAADIAKAWAAGGAPFEAEALTAELDRLFGRAAQQVVPVTDLAALFARFRARGVKLGIASSDNEAAIWATARRFGIDGLVDYVAGYDSGHGVKPEPGMAVGFGQATGLPMPDIAVVGDNAHDIAMGRSAGAGLTIGVLTGTGSREMLERLADACLPSIVELESWLGATRRLEREST